MRKPGRSALRSLCAADTGGWRWRGVGTRIDALDPPALTGQHQLDNAAAVLALVEAVGDGILLERDTINAAMASVALSGRLQLVRARQRRWLLDGAHNVAGASSLAETLAELGGAAVAVLGILQDKDAAGIVTALAPRVGRFVATRAASERATAARELASVIAATTAVPYDSVDTLDAALASAVAQTGTDDLIVVAGSFYTLGPAFDWLGIDSDGQAAT